MADVRPFRGVRFDARRAAPALTIAPPYDVITPQHQQALYARDPHNIVRIEYGAQRPDDCADDNRYTRAAAALRGWIAAGVLVRDAEPAVYLYRLEFEWDGAMHVRHHYFACVRLEEWEKGVIKPHEYTLSGPRDDRLDLLRATRTQVSPLYALYREREPSGQLWPREGAPLYDFEAEGQHHTLAAITDPAVIAGLLRRFRDCDVYIADGHHRYETALAYRDECRARAASWTADEPENFVLMALTDVADPGLLVLPTHRLVNPPSYPGDAHAAIGRRFRIDQIDRKNGAPLDQLKAVPASQTPFVVAGLAPPRVQMVTLVDRTGVEALMPADQSQAWKRLDVNVLQYGILQEVFGIDPGELAGGQAVTYTQDADIASHTVDDGDARLAFLVRATPVDQVMAVADAGGRMPQKSTYFYPKLPTGLVLHTLFGDPAPTS